MSQNLMQSQKPNRPSGGRDARPAQARNPLAIWQRLSIRTKLLVPLALALAATLVILLARFTPSVNEFAVNRTRVEFTTRLNDLNVQLSTLLSESRQVFVQLLADEGAANVILYQVSTDAGGKGLAVATLSTQLQEKMTNLAVPLLDVRYLDKDGKPIVHVVQIPSGDQRRPSPLRPEQFVAEGEEDYFKIIRALPDGQAYITPARLIKITAEADAEPVIQIGMPIYQGNEFYGVVIGRLGIRAFLTTLFQPFEMSQLSAGLVDPSGSVLASVVAGSSGANPPASSVAIMGDISAKSMPIPAELLSLSDQDLREIQGQLYSTRLIDIPGVIQSPYRVIVSQSADIAFADARALSAGITLTLTALFLVVLGAVALISNSVTRPLVRLSQAAGRLSERDLEVEIPTLGGDEVGQLAGALATMRGQLSTTLNSLETRVAERTRNLEIAAEISRDAAQLRDIDTLLQRTVEAIRERFNFYHAQVFLLDEAGEFAVLHTSTGEAGQKLLEMKHKLAVGSESIVGQTTGQGRTFITLDTQSSAGPHRFNVLLPLTRSEIALPLRSGIKVIGALDIQSVEPNAFGENEMQIFQVLADQIAIAIDNARLLQESDTRLRQVAALNRQLTRGSWTNFLEEGGAESLAYQYDLTEVTKDDSPQDGQNGQVGSVSVDITVRGETVGNLSVSEDRDTKLTDDDRLVLQAVADRVSLAIENARLIEQSVVAASRIQQLYEASRTLGNAVDLSEVYRIATEYLSAYDPLDSMNILLARPEPIPRPKYLEYIYVWERKPRPNSPFQMQVWISSETIPLENLLPDVRVARIADIETDFGGYDQAYKDLKAMGVQSIFAAPLATANHWFGLIMFQSERPRAFTQAFVQFASTISDQISTALDNRRLFVNVEAEARRSRALAEAAQLSSQVGVDFETGIANLFAAVAGPAEFDRWWFGNLRFQDTNLVLERVTAQFPPGSPLDDLSPIFLATANNAIAEAARLGQMVVVNDPGDHYVLQNLDRETALAFGKHIALPIRVGPNMVGAMMVGRSLDQVDLDERDIQLVTTLTNQIAVVSENRRLFANAE
jgi:GAF domain-containing protein/HAMP domain-containing protein